MIRTFLFVIALASFREADAYDQSAAFPWKRNISSTIFWTRQSGFTSSSTSFLDGGVPDASLAKVPDMNPFFVALPFNDLQYPDLANRWMPPEWLRKDAALENQGREITTPGGRVIFAKWEGGHSKCEGRWIEIRDVSGHDCYAQWEDVGPNNENDAPYVFGVAEPAGRCSGLDVSPAVAQFLNFRRTAILSWRFVNKVPPGPWLFFQRVRERKFLAPIPDEPGTRI